MSNYYVTKSENTYLDKSTNQKETKNSKPLVKYEFIGGKYPVLIFFESLLLILFVAFLFLLCTISDSSNIFNLSGIPKTIYLSLSIGGIIVCILAIIYALVMYFRNRKTKFEIYDNRISGIGLVKEMNNSLVKFNFDYSQIEAITIQWGYLNLYSKGMVFHIMLTSKDFIKNFKNVILKTKKGDYHE